MAQQTYPDTAPARVLFPGFWSIDSMIRGEVKGLTDEQLDWRSDRWGWSDWGIRIQVSHMASLLYRWLLERWGSHLFPNGWPVSNEEFAKLSSAEHDRRLDDRVYWKINDILGALDRGVELTRSVLMRETVGSVRAVKIPRRPSPQWPLMSRVHPTGVELGPDGNGGTITLEATFRHMYYELLTHLFNVQREKRAQGLPAVVKLPHEGYHMLPGWDVSEA